MHRRNMDMKLTIGDDVRLVNSPKSTAPAFVESTSLSHIVTLLDDTAPGYGRQLAWKSVALKMGSFASLGHIRTRRRSSRALMKSSSQVRECRLQSGQASAA